MGTRAWQVAGLLFLSGGCALVFEVAWLREFRLIFGASTLASAAVLTLFMAGLGAGNLLFGRRADRHANALALYGKLELGVALSAAVSPLMVLLAREVYIGLGGQLTLGTAGATAVRLLLAAAVLGVPTLLMGGTLPAAIKAVTHDDDAQRRRASLLYGLNTLGAVAGALVSTFWLLETLGTRFTLWSAAALNVAVAVAALRLSHGSLVLGLRSLVFGRRESPKLQDPRPKTKALRPSEILNPKSKILNSTSLPVPPALIYLVAAVAGFAFLLMELVWYRMLGPLLGGTTFAFGLILAVALAGLGLGGAAYGLVFRRRSPGLVALATTTAAEAIGLALPFALGDTLALWTARCQESARGFGDEVGGWVVIAGVTILPAAVCSGLQLPLLFSLLGRGDDHIGRHVGLTTAANTFGAILGSLAGGFGLLPLLSAPGAWRTVVILLALVSLLVTVVAVMRRKTRRRGDAGRGEGRGEKGDIASVDPIQHPTSDIRHPTPSSPATWLWPSLVPGGAAAVALALVLATGPTAVWRHSGIGAGRAQLPRNDHNLMKRWINANERKVLWETDGIEAGVAIAAYHGLAFIVNGKADGNAVADAPTQVMLGLLGPLRHAESRRALVVGLGTGETAGWLAEVNSIEQVDVVELEPALDEMAEQCRAVNFDVLRHRKVRRIYNDAREVLLTTAARYDVICSEPSNPFRSGVASLFTREFYEASRARLNTGGVFVQWLQAYEVDDAAVATVLATLLSVFPHAEMWQTSPSDMVFIASETEMPFSAADMRSRLREHPFDKAFCRVWRVKDVEGVMARYIGATALAERYVDEKQGLINTDDRNRLEYGFARTLGLKSGFTVSQLHQVATRDKLPQPKFSDHEVDWNAVEDERRAMNGLGGGLMLVRQDGGRRAMAHGLAWQAYVNRSWQDVLDAWAEVGRDPRSISDLSMLGHAAAMLGDPVAETCINRLRADAPTEATLLLGLLRCQQRDVPAAVEQLHAGLAQLRNDPWPPWELVSDAMVAALQLAAIDRRHAPGLLAALDEPFAVGYAEEKRSDMLCLLVSMINDKAAAPLFEIREPYPVWTEDSLARRRRAYEAAEHPLAKQARRDCEEFARHEKK